MNSSLLTYAYYQGATLLGSTAPTNAGSYSVVATFAGDNNYQGVSSAPVNFTISAAPLTATAVSVTDNGGVYDFAQYPVTAATVTGVGGEGTIASFGGLNSSLLTYAYYQGATLLGSTAPTNAGSYSVVATFAGDNNYQGVSSAPVNFTISAAPLTAAHVSVTDNGGVYDFAQYPVTAATVTGVGGEGTIASFGSSLLSYTYYAGSTSLGSTAPTNAGSYSVVATFAGDTNYQGVSSAPVDFTISAAPLTAAAVSVTDNGGVYDFAQYPVTAATVTGVGGEGTIASFGSSLLSYTYYTGSTSLGSTAPTNAGSYSVVATFAGDTNYQGVSSAPVDFTISAAPLTAAAVSVTDNGGVYDFAQYPVTAATVTGVGGEGTIASFGSSLLSYTYYTGSTSLGSTAPTNAGSYSVVATFAGDNNYQGVSSAPVDFTISAAPLTAAAVSVTDNGGVYDFAQYPVTAATVTGVGGEGTIASFGSSLLTYAYYQGATSLGSTAPTNAGSYSVVATFAGDTNYQGVSSAPVDFTIAPRL